MANTQVSASPKISIVTVSFNQAPYLERAMRSVLDQNYPDLEYIVIDGGSTDSSVDIIKKYAGRLAYWVSEKDGGMYEGLQKGLSRCTGEIMAWINSDDMLHPDSLRVVAEIFSAHEKVQWLQGMPTVIDESGRTVYVKDFRRWSQYNYFLNDTDHIQQESTFWRKSLWEKAGAKLRTDLKLAGDYELWMRFFQHADLYCVKTILGAFRMRSGNQLSLERMSEYNAEVKAVLDARLKTLSPQEQQKLDELKRARKPPTGLNAFRKQTNVEQLIPYPPVINFERTSQKFRIEE